MTLEREALKLGVVAVWAAATVVASFSVINDEASLPHRYWTLYVTYLERKLRNMFVTTSGASIAAAQLIAAGAVIALGLVSRERWLYALILPCLLGPPLYIEHLRRARVRTIEGQIDGFTLSLANALKATPSIGNALGYTQSLLPAPLDQEVGLALKEMRLGHTVDQALLSMAGRIRSLPLDAALSSLLVGRQVGGDVPKILERTAATLREMARLAGVVRSKTAEGKAQLSVLAVFPIVMLLLFDTVSRGYFDSLAQSLVGWAIIVVAVGLWVASLLAARKVLAVDI